MQKCAPRVFGLCPRNRSFNCAWLGSDSGIVARDVSMTMTPSAGSWFPRRSRWPRSGTGNTRRGSRPSWSLARGWERSSRRRHRACCGGRNLRDLHEPAGNDRPRDHSGCEIYLRNIRVRSERELRRHLLLALPPIQAGHLELSHVPPLRQYQLRCRRCGKIQHVCPAASHLDC